MRKYIKKIKDFFKETKVKYSGDFSKLEEDIKSGKLNIIKKNNLLRNLLIVSASIGYSVFTGDFIIPFIALTSYFATAVQIYNGTVTYIDAKKLDSTHIVVVYSISGNTYAVIGTIASGTISFGTAVSMVADNLPVRVSVLDSTHFVVAYRLSTFGNVGRTAVASVSGTTITFGTAVDLTSGADFTEAFDLVALTSSLFIVVWGQTPNSYLRARAGSVSGTTITLGTALNLDTSNSYSGSRNTMSVDRMSDTKVCIAGSDRITICTLSGTTITGGTPSSSITGIGLPSYIKITALTDTLGVVAMSNTENNPRSWAFTVSGTTPTVGTGVDWTANTNQEFVDVNRLSNTKFLITGKDNTNAIRINRVGSISGSTTITYGPNTSSTDARLQETAVIDGDEYVNVYKAIDDKLYAEVAILDSSVITDPVTAKGSTFVTANGNIIYDSGIDINRRGFCYMMGSGTPTTANTTIYEDADYGEGAYDLDITGLLSGVLYSIRAYIVTDQGTSYGDVVEFTTLKGVLNFTGFEGGVQTGGNGGWDVQPFGGTGGSLSTTTVKTGNYSCRFNKSGANTATLQIYTAWGADGTVTTGGANTELYVDTQFRYASKPGSGTEVLFSIEAADGNQKANVRLKSDGKLALYDEDGTLVGTSTNAITQDQWVRLRLKIGTGTSSAYELLIGTTSEISGTRTWSNTNGNTRVILGPRTDIGSQSYDVFFDDLVIRDDKFTTDAAEVKVIKPNANGSTMDWTTGTGASDYTQVNEIPPDDGDTNYVKTNGAGQALFDLQSCSDVSISGEIVAFKGQIITRENSSVSSQVLARIRSGSTNTDTSTRNGNTAITGQTLLLRYDPDTLAPFDTAGIDAIEVGAVSNNSASVRCSNVMGYVLYIPVTEFTTTQDITGKARIEKSVTQTVTGKARVTAVTPRTIDGKANILATTLRTITGTGRIQKSVSQTIAGLSRIALITTKTITGLSRITASTLQTISGLAKITATTLRTVTGVARIEITTQRAITGLSRITVSTLKTITGLARITKSVDQTIDGKALITATTTRDINGVANINNNTLQTIQGTGRIEKSVTQTITGISRIILTAVQTVTGVALITATTLKTVTGLARITATVLQTITGKGRIEKSVQQTTTGQSRITVSVQQTKTGLARITAIATKLVTGLARITGTVLQTITGKARVEKSVTQTKTGVSRITVSVQTTITGVSRIEIITSRTIDGLARITATVGRTATGKARIETTTTQTKDGKARVEVSNQVDIEGKSKLLGTVDQDITGVACIIPVNYMRKNSVVMFTKDSEKVLTNKDNLTILETRKINKNVLL